MYSSRYPALSDSSDKRPPPYAPSSVSAKAPPSPSAPPYEESPPRYVPVDVPPPYNANSGLEHLSYYQVVTWWNQLTDSQRAKMQAATTQALRSQIAGERLMLWQLPKFREANKKYYPKEYFFKSIYDSYEFSACDYYLIYYMGAELAAETESPQVPTKKYPWLTPAFLNAFEVPPPAYEEGSQPGSPEVGQALPPPSYEEAQNWWKNRLSDQQRREIERREYNSEQIVIIRREYGPYYRYYRREYNRNQLDCYDYYLLSRYPGRVYGYRSLIDDYLLFQGLRLTVDVAFLAARGAWEVASLAGQALWAGGRALGGVIFGSSSGSGGGSSSSDDLKWKAFLLGLLAIIVAASSAFVGSIYAGVKAVKSLANLKNGEKLFRSFWRLACVVAGACVGVVKGMMVGALVGSMVPGIGTAAGAVLGIIFGAPITAAIAAAFAKYSARALSWLMNSDKQGLASKTNPEKWEVDEDALRSKGMGTDQIHLMLTKLREKKNEVHTEHSIKEKIPGTEAFTQKRAEKAKYNKFLDAIKQGYDPRFGIFVDERTRLTWTGAEVVKQDLPMPSPIALTA